MKDSNPCTDCPSKHKALKGKAKLKRKARFLVVGGTLTERAIQDKRIMSHAAFQLFGSNMNAAGFYDEDFSYASYVRCRYDPDLYDTGENRTLKAQCRQHLVNVIEHDKPLVIIPLGAEAASMVMGRAVKITKARGVPVWTDEFQCWVMPTTNPHMVHLNPQHEGIFASDCNTLRRMVDYDYDIKEAGESRLGDYSMVTDLQFLIDEKPMELAVDVETLGLRFGSTDTDLLTIQLCPEPGRAYLIPWNHPESPIGRRQQVKLKKQLKTLLCSPDTTYYGQNLKFDVLWLWEAMGFRMRIDHDSKMLAALNDENLQSKDLDTLTKLYCPELAGYADDFNQKYDKSRMDLVPLDKIIEYGCADTDASLQVAKTLLGIVGEDQRLLQHYDKVSIPGLNAFVPIERRGQAIDDEALSAFEETLSADVQVRYDSLISQVPASIQRDHAEKGLKFTRAEFVRDILFNHPDGFRLKPRVFTKKTEKLAPDKQLASTSSKTHLPYFFDDCPFTVELAAYIKSNRLLGTNVRKFRENYIVNGHVYPSYAMDVTVTGRTSSRDPNGQNYPKHGPVAKAYRAIFVPPPLRIQLEADYSQAELRISADMANDQTMLQVYNMGGDIHVSTAAVTKQMALAEFLELSREDIAEGRRQAKAVNFGFIYGMWWKSFVGYAKTSYGVDFTNAEAERIRQDFFLLYNGLEPWHEDMRNFALSHGYVRSYSGRIRHLPMVWSDDTGIQSEALRQAINAPVQEFGSSCGVMAMARLDQNIDPQYLTQSGFVHDAIYASVEPRHLLWGARTLKHYMETNPIKKWFGVDMKVDMTADVGFGMNGKSVHEMGGLSLTDDYDFSVHDLDFTVPRQVNPPNAGRYTPEPHLINYDFYEGID